MRAIPRILTAIAMGAALVLLPMPSGAQEGGGPAVPRAEAQATGLTLNLFGQDLIVGASDTAADAAPSGVAQGTGAFVGTDVFGRSDAAADADTPTAGSTEPVCQTIGAPDGLPVSLLGFLACSSALATAVEGQGSASATSLDAHLEIGTTGDLAGLGLPIGDLTDTLLDPVLALLNDLLGQLPLPAEVTAIEALLNSLLNGPVTLVTIDVGDTESTSTASGTASSATATAEGVRIGLLDNALLGPLATIVIGRSTATATFEGGQATSQHVVAPVSVELGVDLAGILGLDLLELPVPAGQVLDLPLPAPLQSRLTVAAGTDEVDGLHASSTASAVRLDLFTGLQGGGIVLAVADAAAAVQGVAVESGPPAGPPPADDPDIQVRPEGPVERGAGPGPGAGQPRGALPRTGGDGRWVPIGVLMAVGAGVALVSLRRTRSASDA